MSATLSFHHGAILRITTEASTDATTNESQHLIEIGSADYSAYVWLTVDQAQQWITALSTLLTTPEPAMAGAS